MDYIPSFPTQGLGFRSRNKGICYEGMVFPHSRLTTSKMTCLGARLGVCSSWPGGRKTGLTGLWWAGNEGMKKKLETTIGFRVRMKEWKKWNYYRV